MIRSLVLLLLLISVVRTKYLYKSYTDYLLEWKDILSRNSNLSLVEITQEGPLLPDTDCFGPCSYPVYEYRQLTYQWQPTILLVSGFHGNQPLGPHILLEFAKNLNRGHIVIFPLSNPSGYAHQTRQQRPSNVDPNRDFPYNSPNDDCMKTATSRLLDQIYRRWNFSLTISVHQGGDELAWSWGTRLHRNQNTQDQQIYSQIAEGISSRLKSGLLGMGSLTLGQMNDAIYSVEGSFEDWAYAASWDKLNPTRRCSSYQLVPYSQSLHQGLVYIFQAGGHNIPEESLESVQTIQNKPSEQDLGFYDYLTRGVRLLEAFVDVCNPRIQALVGTQVVQFYVYGCSAARVFLTIGNQVFKSDIKGSLDILFEPYVLNTSQIPNARNQTLKVDYQMSCDIKWRNVGKTSFSRGRDYTGSLQVKVGDQIQEISESNGIIVFGIQINLGRVVSIAAWGLVGVISIYLLLLGIKKWIQYRKLLQKDRHIKLQQESFSFSNYSQSQLTHDPL